MNGSPSLGPLPMRPSLTQLPPSPDIKSGGQGATATGTIPELSLDGLPGVSSADTLRRLRSVARYQAFYPQALACSSTLSSYDDTGANQSTVSVKSTDAAPSCLGAIAGPQGVALFRLSRPHVPLLILSHATNATPPNQISSLAFEPKSGGKNYTNSLFLASTRGSGVLIWDASGHSPNPLVGRVGIDHTYSAFDLEDSRLTSLCWKPSASSSPLLATTTASTIALWDLRTPTFHFKPTTKFGITRKASGPTALSPLVQIACSSDSDECATIDASGIVQVYDIRMNDRGRQSGGALSTFAAHETAGVGIAYLGHTGSRWLTWGLDEPVSSAIVKVWSKRCTNENSDEVWDSIATNTRPPKPVFGSTNDYKLTAQCIRPNLACARVCIEPVENKFIAIGHTTPDNGADPVGGWWAELYSLSEEMDGSANLRDQLTIRSFGVEKLAGFQGGDTLTNVDRSTLISVLGSRTKLGNLQAAELSLTTDVLRNHPREEGNVDLLVCCLSDTGVVSTHVFPEALPDSSSICNQETTMNESPTKRMTLRNNLIRTAFPPTNQARVYPDDREGNSLADAASFWGTSRTGVDSSLVLNRVEERRLALAEPAVPSPQKGDSMEATTYRRIGAEGGIMPFDMDVPVAYGSVTAGNNVNLQIGMTDIATGAIVSTNSMGGIVEEGDPVSSDPMQKSCIMNSIETERVPCPRLCGAVFGRGNGGLVIFHNGEVKKMWNWYERTDNLRLNNPFAKNGPMTTEQESLRRVHNATGSGSTHALSTKDEEIAQPKMTSKSSPRTLKDLMNMMAAAREAQWGEDYTSDGSVSDDILSAGANFFEDESLGSNSSDDDDDDIGTPPPAEEMYQRYFGGQAWKGNVIDTSGSSASPSQTQLPHSPPSPSRMKKLQPYLGPSSDMLAPIVSVTRNFDREMLAHQSVAIAEGWELGPWKAPTSDLLDNYLLAIQAEESKVDHSGAPDAFSQKGLPHYRYLSSSPSSIPTTSEFPPMVRTKSDGNLEKRFRMNYDSNSTMTPTTGDSLRRMMKESGVQGGGNSVRPNMEESMKFLKKLFTQPHEGGTTGFSTVFSPPDRPHHMFGGHFPKDRKNMSTGNMQVFKADKTAGSRGSLGDRSKTHAMKLGVYTLRLPKVHPEDSKRKNLSEIKRICLHNASVCADLGENEKEGVWNLLAETVERQIDDAGKQSYNGWGGNGGGALGVELVGNLLKYYEARGDCQMLATMACVLSGGRRSAIRKQTQIMEDDDRPFLLPRDQDEKYDMYIRKYADLLYEWGLLSLRAELNKHLVRVPVTTISSDPYTSAAPISAKQMGTIDENLNGDGRFPGIAVVFQCPKCGDETEFNTNVCRRCQDFAFRCTICDNAVQGLFTACDLCGHGGHVEHMTSWFTKNIQCPTGCGCACTYSAFMSGGKHDVPAEGSEMATNDTPQEM